jgi:hypothetical protein
MSARSFLLEALVAVGGGGVGVLGSFAGLWFGDEVRLRKPGYHGNLATGQGWMMLIIAGAFQGFLLGTGATVLLRTQSMTVGRAFFASGVAGATIPFLYCSSCN